MKLQPLLERWIAADLLDRPTAERILAYEQARPSRPYLLYAVGGLGALAIAVGLLSIVAANWAEIPAELKLGADVLLLLGLSAAVLYADGRSFAREVLLLIYYGATLASIGLVSQVYHLGGEPRQALLLWSIVTWPLCAHGRGAFLATAWLLALHATLYANALPLIERVARRDHDQIAVVGALVAGVSLLGLWLGGLGWLQRVRPRLARVAGSLGALQWVWLASLSTVMWYDRHGYSRDIDVALVAMGVTVGLSAAVAWDLGRRGPADAWARRGLMLTLVYAAATGFAPLLIDHHKEQILAAAHFLVLWSLIGWTALRWRRYGLFNTATAIIGVRLIVIYFEVFKDLLTTGVGLVSGGALILAVAWVWTRKRRQLRQQVQAQDPAPAQAIAQPTGTPIGTEDPHDDHA